MMSAPEPPERAKVCNLCKEYVLIFPMSIKNQWEVDDFDTKHRGHPTQILGIHELNFDMYKRFER